jgi:hypothetical protein
MRRRMTRRSDWKLKSADCKEVIEWAPRPPRGAKTHHDV